MIDQHPAEVKIADFGITSPKEIDVDAIAYDAGVEVRYERLNGCEATLVGVGSKGIASIQEQSPRVRQRFSVGHELGHWHHHRGQSFRCRVDDISDNLAVNKEKEQQADDYAAHLLMPGALFRPLIKQTRNPSFADLREIAGQFETSVLATGLRLIEIASVPAILTCYDRDHIRWFRFSKDVPRRWYLKDKLDEDTFAYDALFKNKSEAGPRKSSADSWFTNDDAENYEVLEHSTLGRDGEVLTLIIPDGDMLEARFDPDAFPKRYNSSGSYVPKRRSSS